MRCSSTGETGIDGGSNDSLYENIEARYMGLNASFADVCPAPFGTGCHGIYFYAGSRNTFRRISSHDNTGLGFAISCDRLSLYSL